MTISALDLLAGIPAKPKLDDLTTGIAALRRFAGTTGFGATKGDIAKETHLVSAEVEDRLICLAVIFKRSMPGVAFPQGFAHLLTRCTQCSDIGHSIGSLAVEQGLADLEKHIDALRARTPAFSG